MVKVFRKKRGQKGFTMIEILTVIAVIGILAAIAIPQFMSYKTKGFNTVASEDLQNMFTAAHAFFSDSPSGTVDTTILQTYGYRPTNNVTPTVTTGTVNGLAMTAVHASGTTTYSVDSTGTITP